MPSVSFYRYSDQRIERFATAPTEPDGTLGGIIFVHYAGDWVSYVTTDARKMYWEFWAWNVVTRQRVQIDSASHASAGWIGSAANATDLVWSLLGGTASVPSMNLKDYSFLSGQTRTLATSTTQIFKPMAMNATAVLLVETDAVADTSTTWIQALNQAAPVKIADGGGVNAWMSARYAVWDDPHTSSTTLYDLTTQQEHPGFADCLRPAIADSPPYLVCVDFNSLSWLLIHVPDGSTTLFDKGQFSGGDGGQIYNGRAFFIGPNGAVQYFDLPTS